MQSFIHIDSPDAGTDIATLVRRALAEVCTVPVLLVKYSKQFSSVRFCRGDVNRP